MPTASLGHLFGSAPLSTWYVFGGLALDNYLLQDSSHLPAPPGCATLTLNLVYPTPKPSYSSSVPFFGIPNLGDITPNRGHPVSSSSSPFSPISKISSETLLDSTSLTLSQILISHLPSLIQRRCPPLFPFSVLCPSPIPSFSSFIRLFPGSWEDHTWTSSGIILHLPELTVRGDVDR